MKFQEQNLLHRSERLAKDMWVLMEQTLQFFCGVSQLCIVWMLNVAYLLHSLPVKSAKKNSSKLHSDLHLRCFVIFWTWGFASLCLLCLLWILPDCLFTGLYLCLTYLTGSAVQLQSTMEGLFQRLLIFYQLWNSPSVLISGCGGFIAF